MKHRPRLRVRGPLRDALRPDVLARIPEDALGSFLCERRWFGGKGHAPTAVRFRDAIPLFDGGAAITRVEVDEGPEQTATYQLPLAARVEGEADADTPLGSLASVDSQEGPGILVDGLDDDDVRTRLGDALCRGAEFANGKARWRIDPVAPHDEARGRSRLMRAEQSNTSVAFGDRSIFKLYRRLAPGKNPDVEIGEFLAHQGRFRNVPRLLATIRFVDDGEETVAGMLQEFVPSRGDAWAFALERARAEAKGADAPRDESFASSARRLGQVTRALHEALAADDGDPDFAPEPATREDALDWGERVARQVELAGEQLADRAAHGDLSDDAWPLARVCLESLPDALGRARRIAASFDTGAGAKIRHHGDYHLGQVLVTDDGDFVILDFEGEPARPLVERRRRHCPLRDVAGMVRSISYAAASVGREHDPPAEAALVHWEHASREAFLDGYFGARLPSFLPQSTPAARRLLDLFEIEKAFYELSYEVSHRPDWVAIPLRGIATTLASLR